LIDHHSFANPGKNFLELGGNALNHKYASVFLYPLNFALYNAGRRLFVSLLEFSRGILGKLGRESCVAWGRSP
jgi:hypothetical protein